MTAQEARAGRLALQRARSQAYYASRRGWQESLAGEALAPARGESCSEPSRDLNALYAQERERETMRALDELAPVCSLSLGSGT